LSDPWVSPEANAGAAEWAGVRDVAGERRATRVLLIDDDERILGFCARALAQQGYEVATVGDAVEGLAVALAGRHDLVVLDLTMPRLPGLAVLDRLIQGRPRKTVLVVSCLRGSRTRDWCLQLGAADYLSKPFTLAELRERVELLTGGPTRLRSRRASACRRSARRRSPSHTSPVR
jgi:DNA-binding response OmpR family regulator